MQYLKMIKNMLVSTLKCIKKGITVSYTFLSRNCKFVFSKVIRYINFLFKKFPRVLAGGVAAVILIVSATTVVLATGATAAFDVIIENKRVATVKDQTVLAEAQILSFEILKNAKCNSLISDAELVYTISSESKFCDAETLSNILIENSSNITKYAVLSVNGISVAGNSNIDTATDLLNRYLAEYKANNKMESVEYCSTLSVDEKYIPTSEADALQSIDKYISNAALPVQSYTTVTEKCSIDYTTKEFETSSLLIGFTKVLEEGEEGEKEVTYKVAYSNGVQTEKIELTSKVIKEPVEKKVLVGTKKVSSADKAANLPMCWPLKRVEKSFVSSYMGDGRNHKGMDIVAPKGTPVFAAEKGTVEFASSDSSGYGNYIIIDHGNGVKTLYAHCSALFVSKGDVVSQGEHIAAVGSTGYSTGNHLHFEVRINGTPVNPAKYIGTD